MVSVEYEPDANAIYIRIKKGGVETSEPLSDDIIVDLDENGEVLGIEILLPKSDVVKKLSLPKIAKV